MEDMNTAIETLITTRKEMGTEKMSVEEISQIKYQKLNILQMEKAIEILQLVHLGELEIPEHIKNKNHATTDYYYDFTNNSFPVSIIENIGYDLEKIRNPLRFTFFNESKYKLLRKALIPFTKKIDLDFV